MTVNDIDVVWVNYHPDVCVSPGMWDQGWLMETLACTFFDYGYKFHYYVSNGTTRNPWPDSRDIIAVVPGRFHEHDVGRITKDLARYSSVLMIVTSDEERLFDWWKVKHPNMLVWVQTPKTHEDRDADRQFGLGAALGVNGFLGGLASTDRQTDAFFAGQGGHERREEFFNSWARLKNINRYSRRTAGFAQGWERNQYLRYLIDSKIAPAPSGPKTVDTFRLWEALEAGCLPIADGMVNDHSKPGYWQQINFIPDELPFGIVDGSWDVMGEMIRDGLENWQHKANLCGSWLIRTKREFAWRLREALTRLAGIPDRHFTPDGQITVVMTTSPIPSHPSNEVLYKTIYSVREYLPNAEMIILADGPAGEDSYIEAKRDLVSWVKFGPSVVGKNTAVKIFNAPYHQSGMTIWALENFVRTPFILFVEHDTPLTGEIDFEALLAAVTEGEYDYLRLHYDVSIHPEHEYLMPNGTAPHLVAGVPIVDTRQWSQRPHLAPTVEYIEMLKQYAGSQNWFIEELFYNAAEQGRFKMGIYAPPGNMQRSLHTDGRKYKA